MRVPLLDLSDQYRRLEKEILSEIKEVLATQRFILGPKLKQFESAVAEYCEVEHAIGVSSGTDALLTALMALQIGAGDSVITTANSFFGTAGSIVRVGARPLFIDIDPTTYNISTRALREYLTGQCQFDATGVLRDHAGSRIRAIMPVHLFGLCAEMNEILAIAREYRLPVIEDAAQAIGAQYPLKDGAAKVGSMGDIGCFSFYPSKNLGAAGDAGLVVCRDDKLAKRLRILREHGMEPRYHHHIVGGNFRMDEIQAAILKIKLPQLDEWSAGRRAAAEFYNSEFKRAGLTDQVVLPVDPYRDRGLTNHHIYHQYVIRVDRRDDLQAHLDKREIGTAIYYPLGLHEQECFRGLGYKAGDFPETERATRCTLALPMYPEIPREAQSYVVNCIAEFFGYISAS
jgi:dTDP-4-amino-4,6-dideoxygalactose transaminase